MRLLSCGFCLATFVCLTTPAAEQADGQSSKKTPHATIVFVADGIADIELMTIALSRTVERRRLPVRIEEVRWASANLLTDIWSRKNQREQGAKLASRVWATRQKSPNVRLCLLGYSGGTAVVLAAAERLPPGTVDRVILLGTVLSSNYDLRPALCCPREGIDSFWSSYDNFLELGRVIGTPDGGKAIPAGQIGFARCITSPADERLYQKLRQHRWHEAMENVDHHGGHFDYPRTAFLEAYVLPLICPEMNAAGRQRRFTGSATQKGKD